MEVLQGQDDLAEVFFDDGLFNFLLFLEQFSEISASTEIEDHEKFVIGLEGKSKLDNERVIGHT